jgi:hypothetical protein
MIAVEGEGARYWRGGAGHRASLVNGGYVDMVATENVLENRRARASARRRRLGSDLPRRPRGTSRLSVLAFRRRWNPSLQNRGPDPRRAARAKNGRASGAPRRRRASVRRLELAGRRRLNGKLVWSQNLVLGYFPAGSPLCIATG